MQKAIHTDTLDDVSSLKDYFRSRSQVRFLVGFRKGVSVGILGGEAVGGGAGCKVSNLSRKRSSSVVREDGRF